MSKININRNSLYFTVYIISNFNRFFKNRCFSQVSSASFNDRSLKSRKLNKVEAYEKFMRELSFFQILQYLFFFVLFIVFIFTNICIFYWIHKLELVHFNLNEHQQFLEESYKFYESSQNKFNKIKYSIDTVYTTKNVTADKLEKIRDTWDQLYKISTKQKPS